MSPKVKVRKVGIPASWLVDSPTNADQVQPMRFDDYASALDYALHGSPGKAGRVSGASAVGTYVSTGAYFGMRVMA